MNKLVCIKLVVVLGILSVLLTGCHSNPPKDEVETYKEVATTSPNGAYVRPDKDSAPWWEVDVSNIPDAIPTDHLGNYKKDPYTVLGKTYYPRPEANGYSEVGLASWYGTKFHGQNTANGEVYDLYGMTAAHKTLPLPSYVKVTNLSNGRSVIVRVNDRGPFHSSRIIDLSFAAAKKLGYADVGTARVKVEGIDPAQWRASQGQAVGSNASTQLAATSKQSVKPQATQAITKTPIKEYNPPANQHASATEQAKPLDKKGLYLQVAAFANPDAAELLRQRLIEVTSNPVFISSVVQGQQTFYRVRLGPLTNQQQVLQTQQVIRTAKLGQATLVKRD